MTSNTLQAKSSSPASNGIKATVFIPTYYGEDNLEELFQAIYNQKTDFEFEVLVIDTSSKDRTPRMEAAISAFSL